MQNKSKQKLRLLNGLTQRPMKASLPSILLVLEELYPLFNTLNNVEQTSMQKIIKI